MWFDLDELDTKLFEVPHHLQWSLTNHQGAILSGLCLAKVPNQFLCLFDIQGEIVGLTPYSQVLHLIQVGSLMIVTDQNTHHHVVSKISKPVRAAGGHTVAGIQGVKNRA